MFLKSSHASGCAFRYSTPYNSCFRVDPPFEFFFPLEAFILGAIGDVNLNNLFGLKLRIEKTEEEEDESTL